MNKPRLDIRSTRRKTLNVTMAVLLTVVLFMGCRDTRTITSPVDPSVNVSTIQPDRFEVPDLINETFSSVMFAEDHLHGWITGFRQKLFFTRDGGMTWNPAAVHSSGTTDLFASGIAANGTHGCAVGEKGTILITEDTGENWFTPRSKVPTRENLLSLALAPDGQRGYAAGSHGTILLTTDGGQTWIPPNTLATTDVILNSVAISKDGVRGIAVGDQATILLTKDGGATWTAPKQKLPTNDSLNSVALAEDGLHGWIVGEKCVVLLTKDGGESWSAPVHITPYFGSVWSGSLFAVHFLPDGQRGWAAGGEGATFSTVDGGQTWASVTSMVPSSDNLVSIGFSADGKYGWMVGGGSSILLTSDAGKTWVTPRSVSSTYVIFTGVTLDAAGFGGCAVGAKGTVLVTSDGGKEWRRPARLPVLEQNLRATAISRDGTTACAVGDNGTVILSTDHGENWALPLVSPPKGIDISAVALNSDGKRGFIVGSGNAIYLTTDKGQNWIQSGPVPRSSAQLIAVGISHDGLKGIVVGTSGAVFRTDDGGVTWKGTKNRVPTTKGLQSVTLSADGRLAWAVGSDSTIILSKDGGDTWSIPLTIPEASSNLTSVSFSNDGLQGWAAGWGELFRTVDGGINWFATTLNRPQRSWTSVAFNASGLTGVMVADHGVIVRTSLGVGTPTIKHFSVEKSHDEPAAWTIHVDVPNKVPEQVNALVTVHGDLSTTNYGTIYRRAFTLSDLDNVLSWPAKDFEPERSYRFRLQVCDGWNITQAETVITTGPSLATLIRESMGWIGPWTPLRITQAIAVNLLAATVLYCVALLLIYLIFPGAFAAWHEIIVNSGLPGNTILARLVIPFLLGRPHCLNAVASRYRKRARQIIDDPGNAKDQTSWVPAPLLIGSELITEFARPQKLPQIKPYVAGMYELHLRLPDDGSRRVLSIEGPGGIGKSSLAFQIARWASDERPRFRLFTHPAIPILIDSAGENLDETVRQRMLAAMDLPAISPLLARHLLRNKRVIVIFDGVSEVPETTMPAILRALKAATDTRALVLTSRLPTNLESALIIRPQNLSLAFLDRVLDELIAVHLGSGALQGNQREILRERLVSLMKEIGDDEQQGLPMIFVKLMIDRANILLEVNRPFTDLPKTLSTLVNSYVENLLRDETDLVSLFRDIRSAACVYLGEELEPASRPESSYLNAGLTRDKIAKFIQLGLMIQVSEKSDPFYKFVLDPVAEQLNAYRLLVDLRDGELALSELVPLVDRWDELPRSFRDALRHTAASFSKELATRCPALLKVLSDTNRRSFNSTEIVID